MKKIVLISILLTGTLISYGQNKQLLTLGDCYRDAIMASPLSDEKDNLTRISQLKDKNIQTGWYPTLDAGATLIYNSNVVDLSSAFESVPIPGLSDAIGGMPHDQYKLAIDINQVIYDGGAIKSSKKVEIAGLNYEIQSVEAQLYKIKEQVNSTFFSLALAAKQISLLSSFQDLIEKQLSSVKYGVDNGFLLLTDYNILRSEKLKIEQQIIELEHRRTSLFAVLSDLTGKEYLNNTELLLPQLESGSPIQITRPELSSFDLKINQLEAGRDLIKSSRKPKAFGFATMGYGSPPGNDFFTDSFGTYATVGAGIKWSITDWNRSRRNEQIIDLNKSIIESRKEDLEGNLRRALEIKSSEIVSLTTLLKTDEELIEIRKTITEATALKLKNGTITATEYLTELNAEKQAVLNRDLHLITLVKTRAEYLYISGKEIE
jgi:outer membrane protein TolC